MCIHVNVVDVQPIFIAVCYFPPGTSLYAHDVIIEGHGPYETLHEGIMFSRLGHIFLLGEFNARTSNTQVGLLNFEKDPIIEPETDPTEIGTVRHSADASHLAGYGHHLLELRAANDLIIYNGLQRWPMSGRLTCFPHGGGTSLPLWVPITPT